MILVLTIPGGGLSFAHSTDCTLFSPLSLSARCNLMRDIKIVGYLALEVDCNRFDVV